jgi:hypothetical protein
MTRCRKLLLGLLVTATGLALGSVAPALALITETTFPR